MDKKHFRASCKETKDMLPWVAEIRERNATPDAVVEVKKTSQSLASICRQHQH